MNKKKQSTFKGILIKKRRLKRKSEKTVSQCQAKKTRKRTNKNSGGNEKTFIEGVRGSKTVELPMKMELSHESNEVISVIAEVRKMFDERCRTRNIIFDNLEQIDLSSALMLSAEMYTFQKRYGTRPKANVSQWNTEMRKLLGEMGFFSLLQVENYEYLAPNINRTFLKFIAGEDINVAKPNINDDSTLLLNLSEQIKTIFDVPLDDKLESILVSALEEACVNVRGRAYPGRKHPIGHWWVAASFDKASRELIVSIFDRGVGIPETIRKLDKWENLRSTLGSSILTNDHKLIESAFEMSHKGNQTRSQTGLEHHGKGLKQILEVTESNSTLKVISRHGICVFEHERERFNCIYKRRLPVALAGTLIEWSIKV